MIKIATYIKKFYRDAGTQKLDPSTAGGYLRTLKRLQPYLQLDATDRILDVGCGAGHLTIALLSYSTDVVGIDISIHSAGHLKNLAKDIEIVIGDAEKLPFQSCSFTRVFAFAVLEHLPKAEVALRNFCECLEPGGSLILLQSYRLDEYQDLWHRLLYKLRLTRNHISSIKKQHINQLKPDGWKQLVGSRLRLIAMVPTSILPTFPFYYAFSTILPPLKGYYFQLPFLKYIDTWLCSKTAIAGKLALAFAYVFSKADNDFEVVKEQSLCYT